METRHNFGSKIGAVLASAGSAVGLGNVWRFPTEVGNNGGAAFIFVYLLCIAIIGNRTAQGVSDFNTVYNFLKASKANRQINWDRLYDVNANNIEGGSARSKYIQEERHVDQRDLNFAARFKWRPTRYLTLTGGLNGRIDRAEHYKKVYDLLGGEYYVDTDSFAEREFASVEAKTQNDLDYYLEHGSARVLKQGDKFGYDYYAQIRKGEGWLNGRFAFGNGRG